MTEDIFLSFLEPTLTTLFFFTISAVLALGMATVFCAASRSPWLIVRAVSCILLEVSRGVPTVVFVIVLGNVGMAREFAWLGIEDVLPGVSWGFSVPAYFIIVGLAFSSSGHLSRIMEAALSTIPQDTARMIQTLKPSQMRVCWLMFMEAAPALIPPVCARLVHHLHNTAFIALFPITGIFAAMRTGVIETALVLEYIAVATVLFILLGALITQIGNFTLRLLCHTPQEQRA